MKNYQPKDELIFCNRQNQRDIRNQTVPSDFNLNKQFHADDSVFSKVFNEIEPISEINSFIRKQINSTEQDSITKL